MNEVARYFWEQVNARAEIERNTITDAFRDGRKRLAKKGVAAKQGRRVERDRWIVEQAAQGRARKQIQNDLRRRTEFPSKLRRLDLSTIGRIIRKA